jgi:O-antigen ligase
MLNSAVPVRPEIQVVPPNAQSRRPATGAHAWQTAGSFRNPQPMAFVPETTQSGFQRLAFRAGLAMLFVRLAGLPEMLASLLHVDTYLLYLVGPPAILGAFVTGGVARAFRNRAAWAWLGFLIFMMLSVPFSIWQGGSFRGFRVYAMTSFPLVFVLGGLSLSWRDVRTTFLTVGVSGVFFIGVASLLAKADAEGRLKMTDVSLSVGNSNDLASQLVLVLPFILYIALDRRVPAVLRYLLVVPAAMAFRMIMGTGSRGALIAIAAAFVFTLLWATTKQKLVTVVLASVLAATVPFLVDGGARARLMTLFVTNSGDAELRAEAKDSADLRRYLLEQSLLATLHHPIFGVGVGQFSNYLGPKAKAEGKTGGTWNETHNTFTEVSSECGIPALLCFLAGTFSAFFSVYKIRGRAKRAGNTEIANACFCYLLSMFPYLVSIFFLANAYRFYMPVMIGLAIALTAGAERELTSVGVLPDSMRGNPPVGPIRSRPRLVRT